MSSDFVNANIPPSKKFRNNKYVNMYVKLSLHCRVIYLIPVNKLRIEKLQQTTANYIVIYELHCRTSYWQFVGLSRMYARYL